MASAEKALALRTPRQQALRCSIGLDTDDDEPVLAAAVADENGHRLPHRPRDI